MAQGLLRPKRRIKLKARLTLALLLFGVPALAWTLRQPLARLFPIEHTGKIKRIAVFNKGGFSSRYEGTRQLNQFAIILDDNFQCEGYDTSFAAVREGDVVKIRGYHDVKGIPLLDPEWWECDEAQLIEVNTD